MPRRVLWVMAVTLVLFGAWWLLYERDTSAASVLPLDRPAMLAPEPSGASASAATVATDAAIVAFTTELLPDRQIGALANSVRIGIAKVAPEDASAWQAWVDGGREGAGPASLAELATVERWVDAPAQRRADGTVVVGPLDLPRADRYELQARGESALHFYVASFSADAIPATIAPTVAAGLRIRREPAADSDVSVLLRRSGETADNAVWQDLLAREAPQLLAAFNDAAIAVEPVQVLAPLAPGALDVILLVDGIEAERRPATLVAGALTDVAFDPLAQQVARALSVELRLSFVVQGNGQPIEGLTVTWIADRGDQQRLTDSRGMVAFKGVDRQRNPRFNLEFPADDARLPAWPETKAIEVSLADEPVATDGTRVLRRTIELRPLQWLVVRTSTPIPGERRRGNPYPIFVLQQEREGGWQDASADRFIPIAEGLAASIAEPGRYRLVALQSPWTLLYSSPADARKAALDGQFRVDLRSDTGRAVELTVMQGGVALARAPLALRGPVRGLPATTLETDANGRVRLKDVTVPTLRLEVPGFAVVDVDVRSASAIVELQPEAEGTPR